MVRFSKDVDLLKWEPVVFRELAPASQTLSQGEDGSLEGTVFTSAAASFESCGVAAGQVVCLSDGMSLEGCYEIVSVDSATQLTVSVLRPDEDGDPIAPPSGTEISHRISTFDPQAEEVAYGLLQYFGMEAEPDDPQKIGEILNTRALRQASVFGVLSTLFAAASCGRNDASGYRQKSLRYQNLFHTARGRSRLEVDTDGDARAEQFRCGGTVRLRRL
ncbi:MAG: hypothetical protein JW810_03820 [Sedimentisphaerales bacterium]|nr:hypothetical protein [Sedimentisphaerales bacterium]